MTFDLRNPPQPSRSAEAQRDYGYTFPTAAADVIDNSVAAKATEINVQIDLRNDGRKFVYFGDNGEGMTQEGLFSAMTYGSPEREDKASLGKFGMGLKSASTSVGRCFNVITRTSKTSSLLKLGWDLDHIADVGEWEMIQERITEEETEIFNNMCGDSGTLVIWSKCDRILANSFSDVAGTKEQQALKRLSNRLKQHVGTVYHRFIDSSDQRAENLSITINDELVEPWDPFFTSNSEQVLTEKQQKIELEISDGSSHTALIRAWILPHSNSLDKEQKKEARITNKGQGFYIYREGRLISQGGWHGVFGTINTMEPHMSLLRIEFDFVHQLDEAFRIDVKKSHIEFDPSLSDFLKELLAPCRREAELRNRRKDSQIAAAVKVNHNPANIGVAATANTKKTTVEAANLTDQTAVVTNNRGSRITINTSVQSEVSPETVSIEEVDNITSGDLWEPALRGATTEDYVPAVLLNKHHDFYQKIYLRAAANGYAVDGMDYLLWAFAVAEQNNSNQELDPIFRDIREEVSANLRKLLRDIPTPTGQDLNGIEE